MNERKYEIIQELLEKMFEFAGYPAPNQNLRATKKEWFNQYQISKADKIRWINWGADYLQKEMGLPRERSKTEMEMLDISFGLKSYS